MTECVVSQHSDTIPTTSSKRRRRSDPETEENQRQLKRIRDIFLAPGDEEDFAGFRPEEAMEADYRGVKRVASDSGSESDTMSKRLRDTADNSSDSEDELEEAVDWTLVQNIRDICNQATSSDDFEGFRDNGNDSTDWQDQALEQRWQAWRGVDASAAGAESDASNESHSSDSE